MNISRTLLIATAPWLIGAPFVGCNRTQAYDPAIDPVPDRALVASLQNALVESAGEQSTAGPAAADTWGFLSGRFVFDGDAPALGNIAPDKNPEVCGKDSPIPVERLVVDAGTGGVANVFVYVITKANKLPIHPSYDSLVDAEVVIDNKNCYFQPHAVAIWTRSKLVGTNQDGVTHNFKVEPPGDGIYDRGISPPKDGVPGRAEPMVFKRAQKTPVALSCNFHGWMRGYILPRDNPYFAVTGADGSFRIENLPAGIELEFQFWHESQADALPVPNAKRGRWKVKLPEGGTDLGEIHLSAANFKL